jgi:hypothetical protein
MALNEMLTGRLVRAWLPEELRAHLFRSEALAACAARMAKARA